jgi:hypothetical protein
VIPGSPQIYSDTENVGDARARYFSSNGIPLDGGIHDKWARYKILSFSLIGFPNFQHRMEAILRHDLHHVVLNLDTSSLGEGLIAAWELGSGCGRYWISWCMEPQALWWGILMAPKKTFSLFVLGRNSKNFFHEKLPNNVLNQTVGDLRRQLLPSSHANLNTGIVECLQFVGCSILGVFMIIVFTPVFLFFTTLGLLMRVK